MYVQFNYNRAHRWRTLRVNLIYIRFYIVIQFNDYSSVSHFVDDAAAAAAFVLIAFLRSCVWCVGVSVVCFL